MGFDFQQLVGPLSIPSPDFHPAIKARVDQAHIVATERQRINPVSVGLNRPLLLARVRVPKANALVGAAGSQVLAVGGESHGVDCLAMALERWKCACRGQIPEAQQSVRAAGDEQPTMGTEGQGATRALRVRLSGAIFLHPGCIPDLDGLIRARRGDALAIGMKCYAVDVPNVPFEAEELLARGGLPDA